MNDLEAGHIFRHVSLHHSPSGIISAEIEEALPMDNSKGSLLLKKKIIDNIVYTVNHRI